MTYSTIARSVAVAVIGLSVALPAFAQEAVKPSVRAGGMFRVATTTAEFHVGANAKVRFDERESTTSRPMMRNATSSAARMQGLERRGDNILARATSRILVIAGQLENLSPKLSARIDAAASTGMDVTALRAALTDLNAKVADAKVQANAAVAIVGNLNFTLGDKTVVASDVAALKDAHAKIQAAHLDIQAAYKDAQVIVAGVKGKGVTTSPKPKLDGSFKEAQ